MGSKKTHELYPLPNINIDFIKVDISVDSKMSSINVICESQTTQRQVLKWKLWWHALLPAYYL
ncbi:MAG: hypothetical protein CM15mP111_2590 [Hyphomicrobiales bacterium]|nr:MAG: hypothetical protein CM15mP111_2590 [Hyphomicrobiales bacterium]